MVRRPRRNHGSAFKAQVTLVAIKEEQRFSELAASACLGENG